VGGGVLSSLSSQFPTFKNELFAGAGVNKNFYWTHKDVFSSETYRIVL